MDHDYKINDNVLIYRDGVFRNFNGPFLCTFKIIWVYTNGTVRIQRGVITERINIGLPLTGLIINLSNDSFGMPISMAPLHAIIHLRLSCLNIILCRKNISLDQSRERI